MTTMKAVRVHQYGGPEVLMYEDVPKPEAKEGDLLVRVYAAGVNPGEVKIRQGLFAQYHTLPQPVGFDFSRVVEALGPGVSGFEVGQAVYANSDSTRDGANAEYVAVRASEAAPRPASLDFIQAASVPLAGLTAWQALFTEAKLTPGQRVLIHGAGGSVGSFAVQFAHFRGAHVIATVAGDDADWVLESGADEIIDYKTMRFEETARDLDVVLDTIGGETQARSWQTLRAGGVLVATPGPPSPERAAEFGVQAKFVQVSPSPDDLKQIAGLIDGGRVHTRIGVVLPLSQAREAHALVAAGGTRGKVVLRVAS